MPEDGVRVLEAQMLLGTLANMRSLFATLQPKKMYITHILAFIYLFTNYT